MQQRKIFLSFDSVGKICVYNSDSKCVVLCVCVCVCVCVCALVLCTHTSWKSSRLVAGVNRFNSPMICRSPKTEKNEYIVRSSYVKRKKINTCLHTQ